MTYNPDIHHRRSIRLKDFDYSQAGAYFVTICTWQRECLFGDIADGDMVLNNMGQVVTEEWDKTPDIRSNVELDVSVIMPNHFHAIIVIHDTVGAQCLRPNSVRPHCNIQQQDRAHVGAPLRRQTGSLGSIVAGFKSATTKRVNALRANPGCPVWQKNYYERVIRNDDELSRAREYIVNNPLKWELDKENPVYCP